MWIFKNLNGIGPHYVVNLPDRQYAINLIVEERGSDWIADFTHTSANNVRIIKKGTTFNNVFKIIPFTGVVASV